MLWITGIVKDLQRRFVLPIFEKKSRKEYITYEMDSITLFDIGRRGTFNGYDLEDIIEIGNKERDWLENAIKLKKSPPLSMLIPGILIVIRGKLYLVVVVEDNYIEITIDDNDRTRTKLSIGDFDKITATYIPCIKVTPNEVFDHITFDDIILTSRPTVEPVKPELQLLYGNSLNIFESNRILERYTMGLPHNDTYTWVTIKTLRGESFLFRAKSNESKQADNITTYKISNSVSVKLFMLKDNTTSILIISKGGKEQKYLITSIFYIAHPDTPFLTIPEDSLTTVAIQDGAVSRRNSLYFSEYTQLVSQGKVFTINTAASSGKNIILKCFELNDSQYIQICLNKHPVILPDKVQLRNSYIRVPFTEDKDIGDVTYMASYIRNTVENHLNGQTVIRMRRKQEVVVNPELRKHTLHIRLINEIASSEHVIRSRRQPYRNITKEMFYLLVYIEYKMSEVSNISLNISTIVSQDMVAYLQSHSEVQLKSMYKGFFPNSDIVDVDLTIGVVDSSEFNEDDLRKSRNKKAFDHYAGIAAPYYIELGASNMSIAERIVDDWRYKPEYIRNMYYFFVLLLEYDRMDEYQNPFRRQCRLLEGILMQRTDSMAMDNDTGTQTISLFIKEWENLVQSDEHMHTIRGFIEGSKIVSYLSHRH